MFLKKILPAACSKKLSQNFARTILPSRHINSDAKGELYDVIIVGGGMVGGTMACALGGSTYMANKKLLLLDAGQKPDLSKLTQPPVEYSPRVCAVSPGNVELLENLNVWQHVPRSAAVKRMQVWDACSDALISFDQNGMEKDLCYIIENDMIVSSLTQVLETEYKEAVNIKRDCKIVGCTIPKNYAREDSRKPLPLAQITLNDGSVLHTKLLNRGRKPTARVPLLTRQAISNGTQKICVLHTDFGMIHTEIAADGANSSIARSVDLPKMNWDYDQSAVIANLMLQEPCSNIVAWQKFLPTGPIALLPLNDSASSLVWSTAHAHAQQLLDMPEEEFVSEINNAFWKETNQPEMIRNVENFTKSLLQLIDPSQSDPVLQYPASVAKVQGQRYKFPLGCCHAYEYVKPRVAFIGDAIHRIHPLAGQGVNLGFRDVSCLTKILENSVYEGKDLGDMSTLLKYESERQVQNFPFVAATDLFKRLFSTDTSPLVALRSMGLMACNHSSTIKDAFMTEAMR